MKVNNIVIVLISAFCLSSCFSYKQLEYKSIESIKVNEFSGSNAQVELGAKVYNPNNYKIKIMKFEAESFVNHMPIGKIDLEKKVTLPKNSETTQQYIFNADLSQVLGSLPSLLFGGEVTLHMKGYVKGKVFIFTKKFPIEVEKKVSVSDFMN